MGAVRTAAAQSSARPTSRPNIVWISNEDMSPRLGAYGDKIARTPVLDRLARESVRYTNAFTTAPVCAPSRAAIITGMYQTTLGVNWYPVRFVKVQFNVIREHLQDPERRPDPSRSTITSSVLRLQFAL